MIAHHCDRTGCGTWQRAGGFPPFLTLTEGDTVLGHFCCGWCLTTWAADRFEPTEEIPL